jgi:hypothetical protein
MKNTSIRVPVYERTCMLTGRPRKIQYAINDAGVLFYRLWVNPVIRFAEPREGHWDRWERVGRSPLPADAQSTGQFGVVRRGCLSDIQCAAI